MQFRNLTKRLDHASDNQFLVFHKETSRCRVICFFTVVHSVTHVRSRIQDKKYRCLILESTQRVERTIGDFRTCRRKGNSSALPRVRGSNPSSLSWLSRSAGVLDSSSRRHRYTVFPAKFQTPHSQTQLHKEESLSQWDADGALAGVSDDVAQELQMPIGPHSLDDVEEPMSARPATLKDRSTPDQIVLDHQSLMHVPIQPWCKMCVESRGRDSPHREQSNIDAVVPQLHFDLRLFGRWRPSADCVFPGGNRHLFWSHTRDDGARFQEHGHALPGCQNSQVGA